jgi:hypothetical protein
MIKPNKIYSRERTAWGVPVSTLIGLILCAIAYVSLIVIGKMDAGTATWPIFPFVVVSGFFTGSRYKDVTLNLLAETAEAPVRFVGDGAT